MGAQLCVARHLWFMTNLEQPGRPSIRPESILRGAPSPAAHVEGGDCLKFPAKRCVG
jgi:hypothetical protein